MEPSRFWGISSSWQTPPQPGIRSFDLVRAEARAFGARGEGPGEFLYPAVVGIHDGDSVVVYDARSRRVSLLDTVFFFWSLLALGVSGGFSFVLSLGVCGT